MRRMICAMAAVVVLSGFVAAETLRGTISEVGEGHKTIKFTVVKKVKKGEKAEPGEEKEFKVAKDAKVFLGKGIGKKMEKEDSTPKGLKEAVEKSKGKLFATIETDDAGVVTSITFGGGGKKKKEDKKKDE